MNHLTPAEDFRSRLTAMTREQLEEAMHYLRGYCPEGTARAMELAAMDATALVAASIRTGQPVIIEDEPPAGTPCPAVSPWETPCAMTVQAHGADPRIAHHDANGDTWFDRDEQALTGYEKRAMGIEA